MTEYDDDLEDLITMKIVVDCYDEDEMASGWYHYLLDHLDFPFTAVWLEGTPKCGLKLNEEVHVVSLESIECCKDEILVEAHSPDGAWMSLPLRSVSLTAPHPTRSRAVEAWRYWVDRGYSYATDDMEE